MPLIRRFDWYKALVAEYKHFDRLKAGQKYRRCFVRNLATESCF